jgi:hypothetical protein
MAIAIALAPNAPRRGRQATKRKRYPSVETQELIGRHLVGADTTQALRTPDQHPPHAAQIVLGGRHNLHPRVRVVDPVHRNFPDAQTQALRRDQQLGVEEPFVVLDERQ